MVSVVRFNGFCEGRQIATCGPLVGDFSPALVVQICGTVKIGQAIHDAKGDGQTIGVTFRQRIQLFGNVVSAVCAGDIRDCERSAFVGVVAEDIDEVVAGTHQVIGQIGAG